MGTYPSRSVASRETKKKWYLQAKMASPRPLHAVRFVLLFIFSFAAVSRTFDPNIVNVDVHVVKIKVNLGGKFSSDEFSYSFGMALCWNLEVSKTLT